MGPITLSMSIRIFLREVCSSRTWSLGGGGGGLVVKLGVKLIVKQRLADFEGVNQERVTGRGANFGRVAGCGRWQMEHTQRAVHLYLPRLAVCVYAPPNTQHAPPSAQIKQARLQPPQIPPPCTPRPHATPQT
jgi:hypothetical protein